MDRIHRSWKSDVRCIGMRYFVYKTGETAADDFGQSTAVSCAGERDSEADQNLKLAVRDAVGSFMQEKLATVENLEECELVVRQSLGEIEEAAAETIAENGYDYDVTAELEHTSFPVKNYGSYTFPAGDYEALRIVIGEGNGHNWWCVMYPNMCFSDSMYEVVDKEAGEKLREVLTTEEYEKVLAEGDYQVRMKYFSWLNLYLEKLAEN